MLNDKIQVLLEQFIHNFHIFINLKIINNQVLPLIFN